MSLIEVLLEKSIVEGLTICFPEVTLTSLTPEQYNKVHPELINLILINENLEFPATYKEWLATRTNSAISYQDYLRQLRIYSSL
jgi:hypothetical protein